MLHFRGSALLVSGLRVFRAKKKDDHLPLVAYLDEFGHIGPYLSYDHAKHNTHPVFGLGGVVLPFERVREFSTFFYQSKCRLLKWEIDQSECHPAQWEKKGASLYTTTNIERYPQVSRMTHRLLNKIRKIGGFVFFVGEEKRRTEADVSAHERYANTLREAIKRLNQEAEGRDYYFSLVIDKQDGGFEFRSHIVANASVVMFGDAAYNRLIEPPIEAESHLFQTLQCADWICGLVGRMAHYKFDPDSRPDFCWAGEGEKLVRHLREVTLRSGIRPKDPPAGGPRKSRTTRASIFPDG